MSTLTSGIAPALLLACLCACWTPTPRSIPASKSSYDAFSPDALRHFMEARRNMDDGRLGPAQVTLERLASESPNNIVVGVWLQEVEIALLSEPLGGVPVQPLPEESPGAYDARPASGTDTSSSRAMQSPAEPAGLAALRQRYRRAAELEPGVARLVLAARIEDDPVSAKLLLDRAEELDPDCPWTHYGRAFLAARAGNWAEVRLRIARAKEGDPGHLPTRWLETWMLSRGAGVPEAIAAMETWLERARGDLRIDQRLVRASELDLALLHVLDGEPKRAREILEGLDRGDAEKSRRLEVEAAMEQALGDYDAALRAAKEAEAVSPGDILPLVQQALLQETWLKNPEAAETAWAGVLALSRTSPELNALLERLRARVKLERYQERRTRAASAPARSR